MTRKVPPHRGPFSNTGVFWLTRAARARFEGDVREEPLPSAHAYHTPLRHGVRRSRPLEALVNYGSAGSVLRPVRNLSPTDAFVEMTPVDLSVGMQAELVLRYRYRGKPVRLSLPATVKRIERGGVAFAFGAYDDITYTHLVNLLYAT